MYVHKNMSLPMHVNTYIHPSMWFSYFCWWDLHLYGHLYGTHVLDLWSDAFACRLSGELRGFSRNCRTLIGRLSRKANTLEYTFVNIGGVHIHIHTYILFTHACIFIVFIRWKGSKMISSSSLEQRNPFSAWFLCGSVQSRCEKGLYTRILAD